MALFVETIGTGPDLVMLPGWGMNGAVFDQIQHELAGRFRVHVVDLPGYGFSASHDSADQSLDEWLAMIVQAMPEKAHLLGWSLGGMLASLVAARYPERIHSLITVASSPRFVAEEGWPGTRADVLDNFATQLQHDHGKTIERFLAIQMMGSPGAKEDIRRLREKLIARPAPAPTALESGLALLRDLDLREDWRALTVPTLHLFGRFDALVPVEVVDYLPQRDGLMETRVFEGSSHAPFITEIEVFLRVIEQFIEERLAN